MYVNTRLLWWTRTPNCCILSKLCAIEPSFVWRGLEFPFCCPLNRLSVLWLRLYLPSHNSSLGLFKSRQCTFSTYYMHIKIPFCTHYRIPSKSSIEGSLRPMEKVHLSPTERVFLQYRLDKTYLHTQQQQYCLSTKNPLSEGFSVARRLLQLEESSSSPRGRFLT